MTQNVFFQKHQNENCHKNKPDCNFPISKWQILGRAPLLKCNEVQGAHSPSHTTMKATSDLLSLKTKNTVITLDKHTEKAPNHLLCRINLWAFPLKWCETLKRVRITNLTLL